MSAPKPNYGIHNRIPKDNSLDQAMRAGWEARKAKMTSHYPYDMPSDYRRGFVDGAKWKEQNK